MSRAFLFPGQGSQTPGMGGDLFAAYPDLTGAADEILGYSVRELCRGEDGRLHRTEFAQPALFVVNALAYRQRRERGGPAPDVLAGHSLGEWSALYAAGCVDFATGLRLVRRRGELMGAVTGGGMLAVLGVPRDRLLAVLAEAGLDDIDLANDNVPGQLVLAGPKESTRAVVAALAAAGAGGRCVPLNVSVAAHSRSLAGPAAEFAALLREVAFAEPALPVIANVTARPHRVEELPDLLSRHLVSPVRWWDTLCRLARDGVDAVEEIGPGEVLTKMWKRARADLPPPDPAAPAPATPAPGSIALGSSSFRQAYGVRQAYVAGGLGYGVTGPELVRRMTGAGCLAFLGAGGRRLDEVEADLSELSGLDGRWGITLPAGPGQAGLVELALRHGVRHAEADAYAGVTGPLVRWRFAGPDRHLMVRVSRARQAADFLRPPAPGPAGDPVGAPVATDLCGPITLLTELLAMRDEAAARHGGAEPVRVGVTGGMGDPRAVAAAFLMGADFVVTGPVNQCCPQARTSDVVKDMLTRAGADDARDAPAEELFEVGGRATVLATGTLFPARAEALYRAYRDHPGLDRLGPDVRRRFERDLLGRSLDAVWAEVAPAADGGDDPRRRMAAVFRWYFARAARLAVTGDPGGRMNYLVPFDAEVAAFNRSVRGTRLEHWAARTPDAIAEHLLAGAGRLLGRAHS